MDENIRTLVTVALSRGAYEALNLAAQELRRNPPISHEQTALWLETIAESYRESPENDS